MRTAIVALASLFGLGCEDGAHSTRLVFAQDARRGILGFQCRESSTPFDLMAGRILAEGRLERERQVSFVADFLDIGGLPVCRATELRNWCADRPCMPIGAARRCDEVELAGELRTSTEAAEAVAEAARDLEGTVVTTDAPDSPVIVRIVATLQPCSELAGATGEAPPLEPSELLGCVFSCPAVLDTVEGDIVLDLDTFNPLCEPSVEVCASEGFDADAAGH